MNYSNDNDPNDDPSLMDILLGQAFTPQERRAIINVLHTWSHNDPDSFPAQLAVLTLAQWRAAANVPVEMARLLDSYQYLLTEAGNACNYYINQRLEAFTSTQGTFEESAEKMRTYLTHLYKLVDKGEKQLEQLNNRYEFFLQSANEQLAVQLEDRTFRARIWAGIFGTLIAVVLYILLCFCLGSPVRQASADVKRRAL